LHLTANVKRKRADRHNQRRCPTIGFWHIWSCQLYKMLQDINICSILELFTKQN
jgi:hypothetical protein